MHGVRGLHIGYVLEEKSLSATYVLRARRNTAVNMSQVGQHLIIWKEAKHSHFNHYIPWSNRACEWSETHSRLAAALSILCKYIAQFVVPWCVETEANLTSSASLFSWIISASSRAALHSIQYYIAFKRSNVFPTACCLRSYRVQNDDMLLETKQ
jgi:hypothetical protein